MSLRLICKDEFEKNLLDFYDLKREIKEQLKSYIGLNREISEEEKEFKVLKNELRYVKRRGIFVVDILTRGKSTSSWTIDSKISGIHQIGYNSKGLRVYYNAPSRDALVNNFKKDSLVNLLSKRKPTN